MPELIPKKPFRRVRMRGWPLAILLCGLLVQARAKLCHRLVARLDVESETVRRVTVFSPPAAARRIGLDEVRERDAQAHLLFSHLLQHVRWPRQTVNVHLARLSAGVWFNHIDIAHVVMFVSFVFVYRGARQERTITWT